MNNYLKVRDVEHLKGLTDNNEMTFFIDENYSPVKISYNNNLFTVKFRNLPYPKIVDEKGLIKQTEVGEAIESGNLYMY